MHNCPDYLAAWLGITRTGAIAALVNTNLVGDSLAHAIKVAAPKCVVVGADLADAVAAVMPAVGPSLPCWVQGTTRHDMAPIDDALERQPSMTVTENECSLPSTRDRALYIYTSGTTGLPKAAMLSHHRLLQWSYWFAGLLDTDENDRMYNCLPMYHSVGGVVAIRAQHGDSADVTGSILVAGVVLAACGVAIHYLGSRVLHAVLPPVVVPLLIAAALAGANAVLPRPVVDTVAIACAAAVTALCALLAAHSAGVTVYCEGKPGAIGRIPPFLAHRFPVALVAFDFETGEPLRDERGLCRRCGVDEVGEAVGRIGSDGSAPESRFDGYTDRAASDRKILRNVFADGDAWFRSGDLMQRDAAGFFHFVDRVGDTFRWKGENVSTGEVADAVCGWHEVRDAVVYGVEVPGYDGRAGMVAVVADRGLDLAAFRTHLTMRLPEFARPVFVRLLGEIAAGEPVNANAVGERVMALATDRLAFAGGERR